MSMQVTGRPRRRPVNKLNELDGKEWMKFTKSWFKLSPPRRDRAKLVHPAGFPETLVQGFIEFFTKRGMWVLDPFLGSGSTLLAARISGRNGAGVDINSRYVSIARKRLAMIPEGNGTKQLVLKGDSRRLQSVLQRVGLKQVDLCVTSPPYWDQLKRSTLRQQGRREKGWDTVYGLDPKDIGNISDYEQFLKAQQTVFDQVYHVMRMNGYMVVVTNNVFFDGQLYPLAFDTFRSLAELWVAKDEKIWLHDDKRLLPLGIYNAWVGNRSHQYCLIFRKEGARNKIDAMENSLSRKRLEIPS